MKQRSTKKRTVGRPKKEDSSGRDLKIETLKVATELFSLRGYFATTVQQIAKAVGTSESLVLYHFKGKEDLYLSCLKAAESTAFELSYRVLTEPDSLADVLAKLKIVADDVLRFFEMHIHEATMLVRELRNPALQEQCRDENALKKLGENINTFLKQASKEGFLGNHVEPSWIGLSFFTTLISIARDQDLISCFITKNEKREAIAARLVQIVKVCSA